MALNEAHGNQPPSVAAAAEVGCGLDCMEIVPKCFCACFYKLEGFGAPFIERLMGDIRQIWS